MMPVLVFFLVWYFVVGRNNPKFFNKLDGKIKPIIGILLVLTIFPSFIPGVLGTMFGLTVALIAILAALSPILIPAYFIGKALGIGKNKKKGKTTVVNEERNMSTGLTRSVPKRRKIVSKFNKKYNLGLEDDEIARIVDASYMSFAWEREIFDMSKEYDSIFEWYKGITSWLRAYLIVFPVQNLSSDFTRQRQICFETFKQIFDEANPAGFGTLDECISYINNTYFASFDETTFMLVYRFLEAEGVKYDLPTMGVLKNESELDKLRRKYDETQDADVGGTRVRQRI